MKKENSKYPPTVRLSNELLASNNANLIYIIISNITSPYFHPYYVLSTER